MSEEMKIGKYDIYADEKHKVHGDGGYRECLYRR